MDNLKGKLSADFRSMNLTSLHLDFFAEVGDADRKNATQMLERFYQAASKLSSSENEFNRRARPSSGAPSLMTNLRNPSQFSALREFNLVKEKLLELNPQIGMRIVRLVEKNIDAPGRPSLRTVPLPGLT
ncbi:MAG: hypothetical protein K8R48_03195 [Alphaproteobacteria bacterium]|nr:hypothetical protein [Alphaproteobacteria bacterium]